MDSAWISQGTQPASKWEAAISKNTHLSQGMHTYTGIPIPIPREMELDKIILRIL